MCGGGENLAAHPPVAEAHVPLGLAVVIDTIILVAGRAITPWARVKAAS